MAIKSLLAEKALDPDGYIGMFYHKCWSIIKHDLLATISHLGLLSRNNFHVLNQALITLVPKKPRAQDAKEFCPISLLHSFAKLFSRILAQWLAPELSKIVAPNQMVSIKSRSIQDNFILVRQSARAMHHKRKASVFLKLDIPHAFDSISWPFLLEVLRRTSFSPRCVVGWP